jgi:glyoxylate/hydroxypyruvate reductase
MTGIVFTDKAAQKYAPAIGEFAPDLPLYMPDDPRASQADVAVSWAPPSGAYRDLPNLKLIHSIGAGANHIVAETSGAHVPLCRIVDPEQARIMAQYVLWGVLNFHREFDRMRDAQKHGQWMQFAHRPAEKTVVGVMGMGVMGRTVASSIAQLGFDVRGWSRGGCDLAGIGSYGENQLDDFLSGLDCLICLLPLTDSTRGILSTTLYSKLKFGAYLIHVGRGDHLVTDDLHAALQCGQLGGALLDVFAREPLPADDPLWAHEKVIVTPHIAAISTSETVAVQVVANVRALHAGTALNNIVQRERGY